MTPREPILAFIVGPTGVGKTAVAVAAAEALDAEIVNVDSRQIYRRLDIGTAKPSRAEQRRVRHHLLDRIEPEEVCTAARFATMFREAVDDLVARGARALAVGGAGLYVDACRKGLHPLPPADPAIRLRLEDETDSLGVEAMHERLAGLDPETAARVGPRDRQRIVRALEVATITGRPMSAQLKGPAEPACDPATPLVYLARERRDLYARIEERCRAMVEAGLVEEVRLLLENGLSTRAPGLKSVGYAEWVAFHEGRIGRGEAQERFERNSRRYAKRQETWFRNRHPDRIEIPIAPADEPGAIARRLLEVLNRSEGELPLDTPPRAS